MFGRLPPIWIQIADRTLFGPIARVGNTRLVRPPPIWIQIPDSFSLISSSAMNALPDFVGLMCFLGSFPSS
jgi:hypothetical protein